MITHSNTNGLALLHQVVGTFGKVYTSDFLLIFIGDGSLLLNCNIWLVGFVALRPKSTAMVIAGRSVHLTTLFPGQA